MIYSNFEFLIFFAIVATTYYLARPYKLRFLILLCSSLFFYAWAGIFHTVIFLFVVLLSWAAVAMAHRYPSRKSAFITAGITVMALHLFFWKYASWLTHEIQGVVPEFLGGRQLDLPLPIGISFFTLQGMAYLIDYRRGQARFMNLRHYTLFKSFFPQLVAGPIVRSSQLLPQLNVLRRPLITDLSPGLMLFVLGFFKKVFIADRVAPFVDQVFAHPSLFERSSLIVALLGYTAQIWADFSGYTDMGRGAAHILGIKLPENFLSPYLALSPSEFWRRWHITLSQWIRDYIYIPLGGNRGNYLRSVLVLLFTMSASGLWHGANWTFLFWGLYHGILLTIERTLKVFKKDSPTPLSALRMAVQFMVMLSCTVFGWLIFRSPDLATFTSYLDGLISGGGTQLVDMSLEPAVTAIALTLLIQVICYFDFAQKKNLVLTSIKERFEGRPAVAYACVGVITALVCLLAMMEKLTASSRAFIYFQF